METPVYPSSVLFPSLRDTTIMSYCFRTNFYKLVDTLSIHIYIPKEVSDLQVLFFLQVLKLYTKLYITYLANFFSLQLCFHDYIYGN